MNPSTRLMTPVDVEELWAAVMDQSYAVVLAVRHHDPRAFAAAVARLDELRGRFEADVTARQLHNAETIFRKAS